MERLWQELEIIAKVLDKEGDEETAKEIRFISWNIYKEEENEFVVKADTPVGIKIEP